MDTEKAPVRRLGQRFEKFGGLYPECVCQRNDVYDRDITLASFDSAHVIPMQVREFSQLLLREAALQAQFAHLLSERSSGVAAWHAAIFEAMTTMSLHTMSVIHARRSARANCPQANCSQKRVICCARRSGPPDSGDKGWNTSIRNFRKDFKIGEPLSRR